MNQLEFIDSLITTTADFIVAILQALAWPVAIVILALIFRRWVIGLLQRLTKIDAFGVKAEMEVDSLVNAVIAADVSDQAKEELAPEPAKPSPPGEPPTRPEPPKRTHPTPAPATPEPAGHGIGEELETVYLIPAGHIMEEDWNEVRNLAREAILAKFPGGGARVPLDVGLRMLEREGALPGGALGLYESLNAFVRSALKSSGDVPKAVLGRHLSSTGMLKNLLRESIRRGSASGRGDQRV